MNDFITDLEWSLNEGDDDLFGDLYRRIFPHLDRIEKIENLEIQKKGIDKIIYFKSGKSILIDEKKRRRDYGDILLEEYSDYDRKKKGWLGRGKYTDYIVYAIMPTRKVYLLPFILLQLCWIENYKNWLSIYGRVFADNGYYRTSSIPIPVHVLIEAINAEMINNLKGKVT